MFFCRHTALPGLLVAVIASMAIFACRPALAADDALVGTFNSAPEAKKVAITIDPADASGAYSGKIKVGGQTCPFTAQRDNQNAGQLAGTFQSKGRTYNFTAAISGDALTLNTGGKNFALTRAEADSGNPLTAPDEAAHSAAPTSAPVLPAGSLMMQPQNVYDPYLQMDAMSLLVPGGWKLDGKITWIPDAGWPDSDLTVSDPASKAVWRQYPQLYFRAGFRQWWTQQRPQLKATYDRIYADGATFAPGFEIEEVPKSPGAYLRQLLVPKMRPDLMHASKVQVVSDTDLPDFAKAQSDQSPMHPQAQSSRISITYTGPDGPMEEQFIVSVFVQPDPGGATAMWFANVESTRAPAGKLQAALPTGVAISSSVTLKLAWFNATNQVGQMVIQAARNKTNQMGADLAHQMDQLHAYARQASDQVSQQIQQNFANQQTAKADAHAQFMHYVDNTAAFSNPNDGSSVTLSSGYKYQYINNRNEIIQTNDASYQPPADPQTSWQPMQETK
jgi:hypothetical protein